MTIQAATVAPSRGVSGPIEDYQHVAPSPDAVTLLAEAMCADGSDHLSIPELACLGPFEHREVAEAMLAASPALAHALDDSRVNIDLFSAVRSHRDQLESRLRESEAREAALEGAMRELVPLFPDLVAKTVAKHRALLAGAAPADGESKP